MRPLGHCFSKATLNDVRWACTHAHHFAASRWARNTCPPYTLAVALLLACAPFGMASGAGDTTAGNPELRQLLRSAQLWVVRKRDDLALDNLNKARLLAPGNPEALAQMGLIALRQSRTQDVTALLRELKDQHPDSPATRELEDAYRLATSDRQKLAMAEFLSKKAYKDRPQMLPILDELFPMGHRAGEPGLTYYRLLGSIPAQAAPAIAGLKALGKSLDGDPRPELETAIIQLRNDNTLIEGLKKLVDLAQREDVDIDRVQTAFRYGLSDTERTPATEGLFKAFEQRFPGVPVEGKAPTPEEPTAAPTPPHVETAAERQERLRRERVELATALARKAETAQQAGQLGPAERQFREAMRLDPADREYPLALGRLLLAQGRYADAEAVFRTLLNADGRNVRACDGLMESLYQDGKTAEAIDLGMAFLKRNPSADGVRDIWVGHVRDEADRLAQAAQPEDAARLLKQAIDLAPQSGWLRYDLAALDLRGGDAERGKSRFDTATPNAEILYAQALFLSRLEDYAGALAALAQIRAGEITPAITAFQGKTQTRLGIQAALKTYRGGKPEAALTHLSATCAALDDVDLAWRCVDAYADMGAKTEALRRAKRLVFRASPPAADDQLRYASLLLRSDEGEALRGVLDALTARADLAQDQREELRALSMRQLVQQAWAMRRRGQGELAVIEMENALRDNPGNLGIASTLAKIKLLDEDFAGALDLYRALAKKYPDDLQLKISLAEALWQAGDEDEALRLLDTLEQAIQPSDHENRIDLARVLALTDQKARAERILAAVRAAKPLAPARYLDLAKAEKRLRNYELALADARAFMADQPAAPNGQTSNPALQDAEQLKQDIENRRFGYFSSGIDVRQLSGTPGTSQILNIDVPNLLRIADGYDGHYFVQSDFSGVFAGDLALSNFGDAREFGTVNALCVAGSGGSGPRCANGAVSAHQLAQGHTAGATTLPASLNQQALGAPIAIGYEADHWKVDLGSTPLGFPASTIVGGVHVSGPLGIGYYSAEIYRRPAPNSLLSYAGTHDPVTGKPWGGVTLNGGGFYLGADVAKTQYGVLNTFLQGTANYLEGENVRDNASVMVRTGGSWSFIEREDMRLSLGLTGMFIAYANNQRHYTFGYGGYWSPQQYFSVAPPIEWTGRWGNDLAYLVRAYVSYSYSHEEANPYYLDSVLQNSPLNGNAYFSSSSGPAFSYGVRGKIEYRVTPELYLGAHFETAQSPFYTPNYGGIYFRYAFEPNGAPLTFPSENPPPYYRY